MSEFAGLATGILDAWLRRHPGEATYLGEHRYDDRLADPSPEAADRDASTIRDQLRALDTASPGSAEEQVDAEVLRTTLRAELLDLADIAEPTWNPMLHNPGADLHALTSRPFAPAADRVESVVARLHAIPAYFTAARNRLGTATRIHTETALRQLAGTADLIDTVVPALAAEVGRPVESACAQARSALGEHRDWLAAQLATATRDPRLGRDLFTAKLALALDTSFEPDALLADAQDRFEQVSAQIIAEAGRLAATSAPDAGTVHAVLAGLAQDAPTDATILAICRAAMAEATDFVRSRDLVTVHDDPVEIIEMPEIDRGVAGAYCRSPGPLEQVTLATQYAVSPTPEDWSAEQVASYYREYNTHMLHELTVHEAMPGHALQLMHSNRYRSSTPVRAVFGSGSFIEGWAVFAEELMADRGYRSDVSAHAAAALRMQQLKMQLRTTLNTILDIRFHCFDLDEAAAMTLMTERAFQEHGEALEKWQRVQLTSTQLCTYYVGYREVGTLAADLRRARPGWTDRQLHDAMLAHGSPPARHVRTLLGLG